MKRFEDTPAGNHAVQTPHGTAGWPQGLKLAALATLVAALAGCGGGGDSGTTPVSTVASPSSPSSVKHTQADVQTVAGKGANAILFGGTRVGFSLGFLGGILANSSNITSGTTQATTLPCSGGGSYVYSFTKSAVRTGFIAGDQLVFNYSNCTAAGVTVNGNSVMTLQNTLTAAPVTDYDILYEAKLTNFSVRVASVATTLNGVANIGSRLVGLNTTVQKLSVPEGQTLKAESSGGGVEYKGASSMSVTEVTTPQSAQYELKGDVVLTKDGKTTALQVSTPVVLRGAYPNQRFAPASGTVVTRDTALKLTTSTAFTGTTASVSGDSDDDGTPDLFFATTWNVLVQ